MKSQKKMLALAVAMLSFVSLAQAQVPTGIGPINIGMTKAEIDALPVDGSVHLASPLRVFEPKHQVSSKAQGRDIYVSELVSPLAASPRKVELHFVGDRLISIGVTLEGELDTDRAVRMISEKYGEPQKRDERKEEQCIYKNGSNFKLQYGTLEYVWEGGINTGSMVKAAVSDTSLGGCPVNLMRANKTIRFMSLRISEVNSSTSAKPQNPF